MLSAIPWLGGDFVQFYYVTIGLIFLGYFIYANVVEKQEQCSNGNKLIPVGPLRQGRKSLTLAEQEKFLNIPVSQLSFFIGLVDGDGTITISNKQKNIRITLTVGLRC